MKKTITTAFALGAAFLLASEVSATQIQNLDVTPTGTQVLIEWDKLADTDMYDELGYALQWSTVQNDVRNDKIYKTTLKKSENTLTLRAAGFDRDETYYFRVYSYAKDGRKWYLNNGSKILKWEWKTNGDVESEFIEANDPVISDNNGGSSDIYDFGNLSVIEYDKSAQFSWSFPSLTSSDYDGFNIVISTKNDLSNPVADIDVPNTMNRAFIEGLNPNTKYYASGYFKKGSSKFGDSPVKELSTLQAFTASKKSRYDKYVLGKGNLGFRHSIDGTSATTTTTNTDTKKTDTSEEVAVKARISELKKIIKEYQSELTTLERKVKTFKSTSQVSSKNSSSRSSTRSTSSTIKKRVNLIAERLRARLNSK